MNIALRFSQLNGLIGDIFSGVGNFFTNVLSLLFGYIMVSVYHLIVIPIAATMDAIQFVFRKFAGLDTYKLEGNIQSGDIVLSLINNPTVQNVFWSLLILAVVLLIITTIVALIKAQTQTMDDKNRKTNNQIFVTAIKALINFFMVPVVAILGIFMGNALLKSLDQATSGGDNVRVSSMLFVSCAYECNRARTSETFAYDLAVEKVNNMGVLVGTQENIADVVDQAFKNSTSFQKQSFDLSKNSGNLFSSSPGDYFFLTSMTLWSYGTAYIPRSCFSIYDMWQVFYYYDLVSFNYLFFIVASLFVLWVLLTTSIGLIKRMFKLVILLVISPPIAALMPLDNGTALAKWRKDFIGGTLSAYATIVAFNLTMMLFGPISEIKFFFYTEGYTGALPSVANLIIQILIICGALIFFKDFTKSISDMIGAEDAHGEGVKATKEIAKKAATAVTAGVALKGAHAAKIAAKNLTKQGEAKKALLDKAKQDKDVAQSRFDALKDRPDTDPEKIKAKNALDDAEKKFSGADKDWKDNQSAIKDYQDEAREKLKITRNNMLSLATNGLSDDLTKGLAEVDKKSAKQSSKDAAAAARPMSRKERKMAARLQAKKQEQNRLKANELARDFKPGELLQLKDDYQKALSNPNLMSAERQKIQQDMELVDNARYNKSVSDAAKNYSVKELREKQNEAKKKLKQKNLTQEERDLANDTLNISRDAIKYPKEQEKRLDGEAKEMAKDMNKQMKSSKKK